MILHIGVLLGKHILDQGSGFVRFPMDVVDFVARVVKVCTHNVI